MAFDASLAAYAATRASDAALDIVSSGELEVTAGASPQPANGLRLSVSGNPNGSQSVECAVE